MVTFVGSMMSFMWIYEGTLDATGRILTLETQGPSFSGDGTLAPYRDIIEIKSPDHRILTSSTPGEDGAFKEFMRMDYHRRS